MKPAIPDFLAEKGYVIQKEVFINPDRPLGNEGFADAYLDARKNEGRLYELNDLKNLPDVQASHPLAAEWKIRKHSTEKFAKYLKLKSSVAHVLEIGCGNGWMTHYLAQRLPDCLFTGMDINLPELNQAATVFGNSDNITWLYEEITQEDVLPIQYFDIIFFAASIQYFPDLKHFLNTVAQYLTPAGEIHILDTPFYSETEAVEAKKRSAAYYSAFAPGMADYYFHHSYDELYESGFKVKQMNRTAPFPWAKRFTAIAGWDHFGWYCLQK